MRTPPRGGCPGSSARTRLRIRLAAELVRVKSGKVPGQRRVTSVAYPAGLAQQEQQELAVPAERAYRCLLAHSLHLEGACAVGGERRHAGGELQAPATVRVALQPAAGEVVAPAQPAGFCSATGTGRRRASFTNSVRGQAT